LRPNHELGSSPKPQDAYGRKFFINESDEDLTCTINHHIMRLADDKIDDTMVIAIDPGDMMKPYAKAMENL